MESSEVGKVFDTAFNQYYSWCSNDVFYSISAPYLKNFYLSKMRMWDYWLQGYVPSFHGSHTGIVPTMIATSICRKLSDLINGDGISFRSLTDNTSGIEFLTNEFDRKNNFKRKVKDCIRKDVELGNALLKLNCDDNNELWVDTVAGNRFFVDLDSRGVIKKVKTYANVFTSGSKTSNDERSYGLMEVRSYNDSGTPIVKYSIYELGGIGNVFQQGPGEDMGMDYKDLPRSVQKAFRNDYGDLKLNAEEELPLLNLGVFLLKNTECVDGMSNIKMGESALSDIVNDLASYDYISSCILSEMYLGRAKVLIPDFMAGRSEQQGYYSGLDDMVYQKIPTADINNAKPTFIQGDIRTEKLIPALEDVMRRIANQIGITVSSIFSTKDSRGERVTATQISSEESNTINYCVNKREIILPAINECIKTILEYYGFADEVEAVFSDVGTTNKSVATENVVSQRNAGVISIYMAVKTLHPNWNEDQIQAELKEIKAEAERKNEAKQSISNSTQEDTETAKVKERK